jgi:hypothetical protein
MMRLVAASPAATCVLSASPLGARIARGVALQALVLFQSFRVLVEADLFLLHRDGALPIQMTFEGRNFDVLSGLSALVVAAVYWRREIPRTVALAWNILGLALLLNIVTIAVLSMPARIRMFHDDPPFVLAAGVPFVLLPTLLVQAALFGHLVVFRKLANGPENGLPLTNTATNRRTGGSSSLTTPFDRLEPEIVVSDVADLRPR